MSSISAVQVGRGLVADAPADLYGSDDRSRDRSGRATKRLTPAADTNDPGYRRISAEHGTECAHATDGAGHSERILQAGGQRFEPA
jgi:hypothetical protein